MSRSYRLRVEIHGAVQGVGFRPYVYRLATGLGLTGWVINDTRGVFIEVEGSEERLREFLDRLPREKPPLAIIQSIESAWLPPQGYARFEIRHSAEEGAKTVLVLPDVATCADCLTEVFDPADRRYRYPFTNCTNCGPRFTIIEALPYDRPHTTMRHFTMCPTCQAEYDNPADRRFHAQPNACPACGPTLALYAHPAHASRITHHASRITHHVSRPNAKSVMRNFPPTYRDYRLLAVADDALRLAARALAAGFIVAVKGLGGFHLMVDARNAEAIARLRERKPRRDKPFALMARDMEQARALCHVSPEAEALLASYQAPIVLLPRRADAPVAENVAPGNPNLGIMLPYTPLHHLLLREIDFPVVATSGNLTDEPICTDEWEAMDRLGHIAEVFLVHNRPIARHVDDSVAWVVWGEPRLLRRARGYAPLPVLLKREVPTILAVGGHLKNTVALSVGRQVFISQHIGDLDTAEARAAFERVIADFLRLYEAKPVAIAHDMHPDYASTQWAEEGLEIGDWRLEIGQSRISNLQSPLIPVQHHHAHLASCLAENQVDGPALGVTWDGTGYGTDGTIWGGEFLLGDASGFERVATLRAFRLPGGDTAIKSPKRVAFALLWEMFGDEVAEWEHLAPVAALAPQERRILLQMLRKGVNAPVTTSMGRLFDAIAALLDLHQEVSFEGQAAMALEFAANPYGTYAARHSCYGLSSIVHGPARFDWGPVVEEILDDLKAGVNRGIIAAKFHATLVEWIVQVAREVGVGRVALTGGVFQNRVLTEGAATRLREEGFEVLLHRQVPPNDGGISLGQIAVAARVLEQRGFVHGE